MLHMLLNRLPLLWTFMAFKKKFPRPQSLAKLLFWTLAHNGFIGCGLPSSTVPMFHTLPACAIERNTLNWEGTDTLWRIKSSRCLHFRNQLVGRAEIYWFLVHSAVKLSYRNSSLNSEVSSGLLDCENNLALVLSLSLVLKKQLLTSWPILLPCCHLIMSHL